MKFVSSFFVVFFCCFFLKILTMSEIYFSKHLISLLLVLKNVLVDSGMYSKSSISADHVLLLQMMVEMGKLGGGSFMLGFGQG